MITIEKPVGKLGILMPGLGAVATTFVAGVMAIKKGLARPFGSLTQMGTVRLGKRTDKRIPMIKDFVELTDLNNLVFGSWDIFEDNAYNAALNAGVLDKDLLDKVKQDIEPITPMKAVFDQKYVKKLRGEHVKNADTKYDYAQMLIEDIQKFKAENNCDRIVMIWCASTEVFIKSDPVHETIESFEKAMKGQPVGLLGEVSKSRTLSVKGLKGNILIKAGIDKLKHNWQRPFKKLMHEE